MANLTKVTVISSKKTKKNNYFTKLKADGETISTPLGDTTTFGKTYYMFLSKKNAPNKKAELDLDIFDIVEREYEIPDGDDEGKIITLSYLFPKQD